MILTGEKILEETKTVKEEVREESRSWNVMATLKEMCWNYCNIQDVFRPGGSQGGRRGEELSLNSEKTAEQ